MAVAIERFASGTWLTRPLITFAGALMMLGTVAALGVLVISANGSIDVYGRPLGTDFSSFWTAGRMALEGRAPQTYEWAAHFEFQRRVHGVDLFYPWSYPPIFLVVAMVVAMLPYLPALFAWQATTLLAAIAALWGILPRPAVLLLGLGFPAVLICAGHGQTGFLTAALLAGGLLCLPRHPVVAGVLFGLLAYKPQFGLLLPFVLAARGDWRAIAAAAATVVATVGLTLGLFGWPVWQAFFDSIPLTRTVVFEPGDTGFEKFQSAFAWMRLWGAPPAAAYALQAVVTGAVLIGSLWIWRGGASFRLKAAALLTGTLLSTPYVLDYDLMVLGMALAFLTAHGLERGFVRWEKTILALTWFAPGLARSAAQMIYLPIGFLALVAVFMLVVVRVRAEEIGPRIDIRAKQNFPSTCLSGSKQNLPSTE
jgi:Glycosyltransferase family 87